MNIKVLKFCNCCGKGKMLKATHNYGNCCGGRAAFTAASAKQIAERNARRARTQSLIEELLGEAL